MSEPSNGRFYVTWPWLLSFMGSSILVLIAIGGVVMAGRDDNLQDIRENYDKRISEIDDRIDRIGQEVMDLVKRYK